jgi:hypothetical protein
VRLKCRSPRTFGVLWLLASGAAGVALAFYHGWVVSEGPCAPGAPHCGLVLAHPLAPLGVFVWIVGLVTGAILWHFGANNAEGRKRS